MKIGEHPWENFVGRQREKVGQKMVGMAEGQDGWMLCLQKVAAVVDQPNLPFDKQTRTTKNILIGSILLYQQKSSLLGP